MFGCPFAAIVLLIGEDAKILGLPSGVVSVEGCELDLVGVCVGHLTGTVGNVGLPVPYIFDVVLNPHTITDLEMCWLRSGSGLSAPQALLRVTVC